MIIPEKLAIEFRTVDVFLTCDDIEKDKSKDA
jgi:hypothetical protein